MRSSLTLNDNAFFHIFLDSDTMTKHTYLPVMIPMSPIIVDTNNCKNKWKNSLQTHENKEYAAYLQKLRKICLIIIGVSQIITNIIQCVKVVSFKGIEILINC